ncbi:MAG TPA: potassium-transporting ATPase subunit KdpA, partial [Polyangiaceae bacterium]|nr:potassium-transporting ATPase subunit KdpA [Polyangiaceae bacterium]
MTAFATAQMLLFFGLLFILTRPLGTYMAKVFSGEKTFMSRGLGWLERGAYRALGIDPEQDMKWTT